MRCGYLTHHAMYLVFNTAAVYSRRYNYMTEKWQAFFNVPSPQGPQVVPRRPISESISELLRGGTAVLLVELIHQAVCVDELLDVGRWKNDFLLKNCLHLKPTWCPRNCLSTCSLTFSQILSAGKTLNCCCFLYNFLTFRAYSLNATGDSTEKFQR